MKFTMPSKEIYIRLAENEPVFVCTIRYGALASKATRFSVQAGMTPELDEGEAFSMIRRPLRAIAREKPW